MPRRNARAAAPAAAPTQEQIDARYGESISANKLKSLLKSAKTTAESVSEISGALGQQIANAVEDNHLHRKAFNMVKALNKMDAEKLAECMHWFRKYFAMADLQTREDSALSLAFGPGDAPGAEQDEGADEGQPEPATARNVRAFPRPTSVAAE